MKIFFFFLQWWNILSFDNSSLALRSFFLKCEQQGHIVAHPLLVQSCPHAQNYLLVHKIWVETNVVGKGVPICTQLGIYGTTNLCNYHTLLFWDFSCKYAQMKSHKCSTCRQYAGQNKQINNRCLLGHD